MSDEMVAPAVVPGESAASVRADRDRDMVQLGRVRTILWVVERRGLPLPSMWFAAAPSLPMTLGFQSLDELRWWLDAFGPARLLLTSYEGGSALVTAQTDSTELGRLDLQVSVASTGLGEVFRRRPVDSLEELRGLLAPPPPPLGSDDEPAVPVSNGQRAV